MNNMKKSVIVAMLAALCSAAWSISPDELLLHAARIGNMNVLKEALAQRSNPNCTDASGKTVLMYACEEQWYEGVVCLIGGDANVNLSDMHGRTALMYAVQSGMIMIVQRLLDNGANVNAKDFEDKTVMMYAIESKNGKIVDFLLKQRVDCFATDMRGDSIAMYTVKYQNNILLDKLMGMFIPIDWYQKNNDGLSPFTFACKKGNFYAVKRILQEAPIDVSDSRICIDGDPIIIWLVAHDGAKGIIKYLIEFCSPKKILSITDYEGHDIKYWAEKQDCEWILAMLDEIEKEGSR